ncbi:MAG: hypothetical protein K2X36_08140, partial [Microbacteriaceae bacterium]|nr:hypothetical protein [Microbacteriaceae bacterium]
TGTFITGDFRLFLLMAKHILGKCKPTDVAIATSPERFALQTLGNLVAHQPIDVPSTEIDIFAIEMLEDETKRIINDGWCVINPSIRSGA